MPAQSDNSGIPPVPVARKKFRSLARVLLIAILSLVVAVLIVDNVLAISVSLNREQTILVSDQVSIAKNAAVTVKEFIDERIKMVTQFAHINDLFSLSSRREIVMNKLIGFEPSFRELILTDTQGKQVQAVSRMSNSDNAIVSDEEMKLLLTTIRQKNTYIGKVNFDSLTQEPIMIIAVPAKNIFGDVEGALIAEVNLKFMWDLVGSLKVGNNGLAYVIDKQGNLIAFGDVSRVLKRENLKELKEVEEFVNSGREDEDSSVVGITKGIQGRYVVSNFVALGSPDWAVVIEMPFFEAYHSLISEISFSLLILLSSVLASIFIAIYLSKRITRPIISLTQAVKKIGGGDLETKIQIESRDETGQLALVFNQMTEELKHYYDDLEQKIAERTKSLDQKVKELEKFNELTIGRELKMIEMKKEIEELKKKAGGTL
jgi:methyl-accepting chemotaxis protein